MQKYLLFCLTLAILFLLTACNGIEKEEETSPSLYSRLGGNAALTVVVDDFTGRVAADDRINQFFQKSDIIKFKRLLVQHLCLVTGGNCRYTGRDMYTIHKGMGITSDDFTALVEDLIATLDFFNVPETEKNELLEILGPLQINIVEK